MFGFVKNFLARLAPAPAPNQDAPAPLPVPSPPPAPNLQARPRYNGNGARHDGTDIQLPLEAILNGLPPEVHPHLRWKEAGRQTIPIPLETILPQLARGIVKTSFVALRQAAPHLFSQEADRDNVQVALPLGEILSRLNPAFILRRRSQKQAEVPEEVSSPFGPQGQVLAIAPGPATPEPPPDPLPLMPPGAARRPPGLLSSIPSPAPRNSVIPMPSFAPLAMPPLPSPGLISPPGRQRDLNVLPPPSPAAVAQPPAPGPAAQPFTLSLVSLAQGWPEAVRGDILQLNLADAKVALPAHTVEQALRQGRVAFSWKTLRSWIKPAPGPAASAQDNIVVELPLQIVAPLFLARQRQTSQSRQKVTIDQSIPNLFFGFPQPETPGSAPAPWAAQDSNGYVSDEASDTVRARQAEAKHSLTPGTRFIAKYATPNEIVSRAAALDDVAGALIGLPDGLLVASRLGPDLNADTLAAFLPQIFGKVSRCTKELRMGELNNLSFTVGDIAWKLFRVNAIFFAAFGHAGQPLPASQLAALAAELDHKPK
jgi:predicted regulator of Ras-like GTPase activity (Roadblock/LC7/MglB family)